MDREGEFDKAIASFDEAIRLDPKIANLPFYKRYRAAAESLRTNAQDSKFAEEVIRGLTRSEKADYDQAIAAWDEAIRLDPNHSEAHRWRGDASLNKHEFDKALSEYDEAIRLDPKNGMAYWCRGAALTGKGEFDKAIASFDEAIRLDPRIANIPYYKRFREVAEAPWSMGLLVASHCSLSACVYSSHSPRGPPCGTGSPSPTVTSNVTVRRSIGRVWESYRHPIHPTECLRSSTFRLQNDKGSFYETRCTIWHADLLIRCHSPRRRQRRRPLPRNREEVDPSHQQR